MDSVQKVKDRIEGWKKDLEACRNQVAHFSAKADAFSAAIEGAMMILADLEKKEEQPASEEKPAE